MARAGNGGDDAGTVVFTFGVNSASGIATFNLDDQLDHDGLGDEETLSIGDLGSYVEATITDTDGDTDSVTFDGKIGITVENDVPIISLGEGRATGAVQEDALGNELVDGATDDTDSSLGNFENAGDTDTATMNLANLLDSPLDGADEPADVTYDITGIGVDGVKSDYTSNGAEVWYFKQDGKLVARAGNGGDDAGTVVFTFGVNSASGIATFNLDDQLDHDGLGDEETLSIGDLGSYVEATITDTDGDTDSVTFDGKIGITVENDVPIISLGEGRATGAVQEDALGNELVDGATDDTDSSLGNFENAGDTDTATMNLANLLDSPLDGADEPADVTYDITGIGVDGVKSDYTSNGAEVWYFKQDGKLVARAGNGGDDAGTVVFTFGVNSASGIATFNLDDQLDHDGLGDEETLSIGDLGSYVEATITDTDGDTDSVTFDGKIGITVENDVPIISLGEGRATGAVQEDALGNELVDGATDDTDSSLGNFENAGDTDTATMNLANLLDSPLDGADEPADVTYDITGIGVDGVKSDYTSNGAEVWYFKQDGKLVARAGNGGDDAGTVVFTFGVNSASGIATFNLDDQLDHDGLGDEETLSIGDLGSYVEATITDTDGDTDSVTFDGKIGITVENDVPIISLGEGRATGAVQEDALGNELVDGATDDTDSSLGNFENAGDTDTATMNLANLLDSPLDGADEPADVTYDITGIGVDGVKSDYTSNGAEVWYFKQDGKLVARAGNGGDDAGTVVFTFGVNSASGIATFNLDDQLDHDGLGDEETLSIGDLGSYVEATITDTDGDTDSVSFDGKIGITVENDVPVAVLQPAAIIGSVLEDGLSDASGDAGDMSEGIRESGESLTSDEDSGSSDPLDASNLSNLFVSGADEPITSYGITTDPSALATLDALYSHGEKISYSVSQGVSADTLTGTSTSGTVFTLTVNHDGSWAFDLDDQLDHVDNDLNDENKELRTGDDGLGNPTSSASAIDFSAVITATDADGDTTVGAAPGSFKVEVEDDIPEAASTTQIPGNMNLVLILDNSGSMYSESVSFGGGTVTRAAALEASVVALLTSLAGSADGSTYRVHLVEYNTDSASLGTYTITGGNLASANAAIAAIQGMAQPGGDDVYTNYEAGYQQALQWINSGGALTEADVTGSLVNEVVFISDGDPNRWNDPDMGQPGGPDADGSGGGSSDFALEQVTGSDGSNEITAIGAWADNVRAIGINVSGDQDDRLDTLDLTSDAFNITSGDQLLAILPELIKVPLPIISATVEEDDLTVDGDALTDPDNSTGINEDGSTNADETAGSTVSTDATNLANLFVSGADEELSYGMSTNVSGLPNLYSNGVALAYNVVGNTLTGSAGGNTIFTFTVNADGSWSFDLDGQLDHVAGDGENFDLLSGNGTDKVEGIDLSTVIVAVDADGDEVQANAGSFVMSVQDDVPDIGTPQDSLLAIQQGNSLTASLDIEGSGADDPHSISLGLTEGALVQTIGGATMTSGGKTLFWHANDAEGTSWSAVTHTSGGAPLATSFTVSVDEASGTYTVEQSGILDGASSTKIITFDANGAMGGGNTYEAVFGAGGTEVENGDITTYSNSVFIWAKASTDLVSPFGWNGVTDTWVDDTTTVNYSSSGIGVGDGAMIDGTTFAGSRNSEILSLKFFSELEVDYGGSNQEDVRVNEGNSQVLNLTGVKLVLDHLGHDETAYYTLWNDGVQVSQTYSITGLDNGTGSSADNKDDLLTITNSQLNAGETVFDEVRLESGTGGSNAYRVQSAEVTIFQPGVDETINIPVLVEDADGDVVTDSFSVTFDGQGNLDATVADAADGDDSVNGMVIVGSSGDNTIIGTDYDDTIDGKGGNDNITGGAGDDNIEGGAGSDILVGNIGDDNLYGDAGNDILSGGDGNDQLIGGTGTDNLSGGANDDTLVGDNVNFSTPGDPVVVEDAAPDVISGGSGSDVAGNQSGTPANTDTITTTESIVLDIDTLVPPPEDTV
ncbi:MAG: DUF5801 domain-containing protein [Desulforhopalus sp.]|nr:DUF5801 domain-containing protein [Desulforhopalus sp.]